MPILMALLLCCIYFSDRAHFLASRLTTPDGSIDLTDESYVGGILRLHPRRSFTSVPAIHFRLYH
jgi:hypothetical protein